MAKRREYHGGSKAGDKHAILLMTKLVEAGSDREFAEEASLLGYSVIPKYSYGKLSEPGYCLATIVEKTNSNIFIVLNRGVSWQHQNWNGLCKEWSDIMATLGSKPPADSDMLPKKIYDIRREETIEKMTVIGHSRGALVVQHNADKECFDPIHHANTRLIAVESPGVNGLKVKNTNTIGYKAYPNFINCWGGLAFKTNSMVVNYTKIDKGFFEMSCDWHSIKSIYDNFHRQLSIQKWVTPDMAYFNFLHFGGKMDWLSMSLMVGAKSIHNSFIEEEALLSTKIEEDECKVDLIGGGAVEEAI